MLENLFVYLSLSLSISYMWSFSTILKPVRQFISKVRYIRVPLLCPECSSFWFGLLVSFLYNPIQVISFSNIFCGLITHFYASLLYKRLFPI